MPLKTQKRIAHLTVEAFCHGINQSPHLHKHLMCVPQAVETLMGAIGSVQGESVLRLRIPGEGNSHHKPIQGKFGIGNIVLGIDNAVSTGGSALKFAAEVETYGLLVSEVVVLADREEGGVENLRRNGYGVIAATTLSEIRTILDTNHRLTGEQLDLSKEYSAYCAATGTQT